jgi:hypothetical protein
MPNVTPMAAVKLVPVSVSLVPPLVGPEVGVKLVSLGGVTNVKWPSDVLIPSGVMTLISTDPAAWLLVNAVILYVLVTVKLVAGVDPK